MVDKLCICSHAKGERVTDTYLSEGLVLGYGFGPVAVLQSLPKLFGLWGQVSGVLCKRKLLEHHRLVAQGLCRIPQTLLRPHIPVLSHQCYRKWQKSSCKPHTSTNTQLQMNCTSGGMNRPRKKRERYDADREHRVGMQLEYGVCCQGYSIMHSTCMHVAVHDVCSVEVRTSSASKRA